jgi:hypothetical protein
MALSRLPQRESETWDVDLRPIASSAGAAEKSQWVLLAIDSTGGQVVHYEFLDDRPKDAQAWSVLIAALLRPLDDEPHRPAVIRLLRKTWFRSWESKLRDIGIECRLTESLEPVDEWLRMALPQLAAVHSAGSESDLSGEQWSKLSSLPVAAGEVWQADVQRLPVWLDVEGELTRPLVSLVADENELILATNISGAEPHEACLLKSVWQALMYPAIVEARLPGTIQVASDEQREVLAAHLERLGVQCVTNSELPQVRRLIATLVEHFGGGSGPKSLLDSPGVTLSQLGGLFEAAAQFYRDRPWRRIPSDVIIRAACDRFTSRPWFAVVMGQSGIEQGMALYEDPELLDRLLNGDLTSEQHARRASTISLTFGEAYDISPVDVDAAAAHGWHVAGPEAYPCILRVNPGVAFRTLLKWELELLEGCLLAIPKFLNRGARSAEIEVVVSGERTTFVFDRVSD